ALGAERRLDIEAIGRRDIAERRPAFDLFDDLVRFGLEPLANLIVAPARLDLGPDLVAPAGARGRAAKPPDPEISASRHLHRLVLDPDIRTKDARNDICGRKIGDLLVFGVVSLTVETDTRA